MLGGAGGVGTAAIQLGKVLGAEVIIDPVGGDTFDQIKRCINWEGRIVIIDFTSGRIPQIECNRILLKNMSVIGLAWGQYLGRDPAKGEAYQKHLYDLLALGAIEPLIFRSLPFDEVKQGMHLIEGRDICGKVVMEQRNNHVENLDSRIRGCVRGLE